MWLRLWDDAKSKSILSGEIPLSIYLIHNVSNDKLKTSIHSEIKRRKLDSSCVIYLDPKYSVPIACHSIFQKMIDFIEQNDARIEVKSKICKSEGKAFRLPNEYKKEDKLGIDTYTIKNGYAVKKMKTIHPDSNKDKLIISNKVGFSGILIDKGNLGLVGTHKFYILGKKLDLLGQFLSSKLCLLLSQYTKYGQNFLDKEVFTFIPDVRIIDGFGVETMYELFGFTDEEIHQIDTFK
jgi:hypothetical protein